MIYVLAYRNTTFWLVGGFGSVREAENWASDPTNNPSDDPRWRVIEVDHGCAGHMVVLADGRRAITADILTADQPMAAEQFPTRRVAA